MYPESRSKVYVKAPEAHDETFQYEGELKKKRKRANARTKECSGSPEKVLLILGNLHLILFVHEPRIDISRVHDPEAEDARITTKYLGSYAAFCPYDVL